MIKKNFKINNGYIALMSVLIFGAVSLAIIISVVLLGLSSARTSFSYDQSIQAEVLATACVEEGMQYIADTLLFNGSSTLALGFGTCNYNTTSTTTQNGENIIIKSTGLSGSAMRKIKVIISTTTPSIIMSSWQEVDNF